MYAVCAGEDRREAEKEGPAGCCFSVREAGLKWLRVGSAAEKFLCAAGCDEVDRGISSFARCACAQWGIETSCGGTALGTQRRLAAFTDAPARLPPSSPSCSAAAAAAVCSSAPALKAAAGHSLRPRVSLP